MLLGGLKPVIRGPEMHRDVNAPDGSVAAGVFSQVSVPVAAGQSIIILQNNVGEKNEAVERTSSTTSTP